MDVSRRRQTSSNTSQVEDTKEVLDKEEVSSEEQVKVDNKVESTQEPKKVERKPTPQKNVFKEKFTGYIHVDTFLSTARVMFNMSDAQVEGFKAFMYGKFYQTSERDFIPYLEKYLGRDLNI